MQRRENSLWRKTSRRAGSLRDLCTLKEALSNVSWMNESAITEVATRILVKRGLVSLQQEQPAVSQRGCPQRLWRPTFIRENTASQGWWLQRACGRRRTQAYRGKDRDDGHSAVSSQAAGTRGGERHAGDKVPKVFCFPVPAAVPAPAAMRGRRQGGTSWDSVFIVRTEGSLIHLKLLQCYMSVISP